MISKVARYLRPHGNDRSRIFGVYNEDFECFDHWGDTKGHDCRLWFHDRKSKEDPKPGGIWLEVLGDAAPLHVSGSVLRPLLVYPTTPGSKRGQPFRVGDQFYSDILIHGAYVVRYDQKAKEHNYWVECEQYIGTPA